MTEKIISMYITMMPVILAGILNMLVVKQSWFKKYAKPIDCGAKLKDAKRIFGDNKTGLGIFTMILCSIVTHVFWGLLCGIWGYGQSINQLYILQKNTVAYNMIVGFAMGVSYMIFELPNSFIKRRLEIPDGKTVTGIKGKLFFIIDQIDSMFGVILALKLLSNITWIQYANYVILGGLTHISVNIVLYKLKIRRNL